MMTRQDFNNLAVVISDQVETNDPGEYGWDNETRMIEYILSEIASDIADVCAGSNGNFDRKKFLTACGFPNM